MGKVEPKGVRETVAIRTYNAPVERARPAKLGRLERTHPWDEALNMMQAAAREEQFAAMQAMKKREVQLQRARDFEECSLMGPHSQPTRYRKNSLEDFDASPSLPVPIYKVRKTRRCII